jgi:hypothetical protein
MSGFRDFTRFCVVAFLAAGASVGCATAFKGNSHVPGGAAGCSKICSGYGMDLAGMVAMGEYSDGCICKVRGQAASSSGTELAVSGAGPAAIAIIQQTRRSEQDAQRATMIH